MRRISTEFEEWEEIPDFDGRYFISSTGRVKSIDRWVDREGQSPAFVSGRVLSPNQDTDGYELVVLSKENKSKTFKVHRLVAQAFVPNPGGKPQVNHLDTIRHNNLFDNLEWATPKENCNHRLKI